MEEEKKELEERLANPPNLYTQEGMYLYYNYLMELLDTQGVAARANVC